MNVEDIKINCPPSRSFERSLNNSLHKLASSSAYSTLLK